MKQASVMYTGHTMTTEQRITELLDKLAAIPEGAPPPPVLVMQALELRLRLAVETGDTSIMGGDGRPRYY